MPNRLQKIVKKAAPAKKQKPIPVKIVSDAPNAVSSDDSWRARDALSTLARAEEIRRDKPLMKAVKAEAKKQVKSLSSVCK